MKQKPRSLISILMVLILIVITASFTGILDVSSSPNSWVMNYKISNIDKLQPYFMGSPFIVGGQKIYSDYPLKVGGIWQHEFNGIFFKDGEQKEVLPGINAELVISPPQQFAIISSPDTNIYGAVGSVAGVKELANRSLDWDVKYYFSYQPEVISVSGIKGSMNTALSQPAKAEVELSLKIPMKLGINVDIGSGLFTGGRIIKYSRETDASAGKTMISIDLPTDQLGKRTVNLNFYSIVYDNSDYGSSDLCWVADKLGNKLCAQEKTINLPITARFDYYVLAQDFGQRSVVRNVIEIIAEAQTLEKTLVVRANLSLFDRIWDWLARFFQG